MSRYYPRPDCSLSLARGKKLATTALSLTGTPEWLRGRTLLFASDFHLRPRMDPKPIASQMAACRADMILLGGDYADRKDQALRLFDALRPLRAPLGVYAVAGNNDVEAFGDLSALRAAVERFGGRLLVNEGVSVSLDGGTLRIAGVDEYRYGAPSFDGLFPDPGDYQILLSHYPILPKGEPPDLMLTGHTHGGQFNFLGLTPFAIGFERIGSQRGLAPAMVSGARRFGQTMLVVSKGIGASRIPLRIGVRAEIHRLTFC